MVRRLLLVLVLAMMTFSLLGCQTVQGIGKDITSAGKAGEKLIERP